MKKFFREFKTFITRGNVMDMAVGVIIGGAFTAIVTALTTNILQPLINWILALIVGGDNALESAVTVLKPTYVMEEGKQVIDLANSIYLDWGAFISAIINFILVAFVLFCIIRAINRASENAKAMKEAKAALTKEERKSLRKEGKSCKEIYAIEQEKIEEAKRIAAEAEAAKPVPPTTEELLEQILETIKNK